MIKKFRIWDKVNKTFTYFNLPDENVIGISYLNYPSRQVYQQWTGLKDRDGKEIYEGDILFYENECFYIEFQIGCFYAKGKNHIQLPLNEFIIDKNGNLDTKIAGNIFENPELSPYEE